ncbi:DegT/DnrJ/EryC1/StrS family aminotransferase [Gemmatimonas sp.]
MALSTLAQGARGVLHSRIAQGQRGELLEGPRFQGRDVWLTDSGTTALTLALLESARDGAERIVALPAYCCPDLATAAVGAGSRIRLYDVNPRTLEPDWESVHACLQQGATQLVIAHLLGRIADMQEAHRLAASFGATVIEDAAQGAGGARDGVPSGALADYSVMSFGRGKGLNAGGGGALTVRRGASFRPFAPLREQGRLRAAKALAAAVATEFLSQPIVYGIPAQLPFLRVGETVYHEPSAGALPSTATVIFMHEALAHETTWLARRQGMEAWYEQGLNSVSHALFERSGPSMTSGALRFPFRASPAAVSHLVRFGVVRYYPRTLAEYPAFAQHVLPTIGTLSGAKELASLLHTAPTHHLLSEADRTELLGQLISAMTSHP